MGTIKSRPTRKDPKVIRHTAEIRIEKIRRAKTFRTLTQAKEWIEREEAGIRREAAGNTLIREKATVADAVKKFRERRVEHLASDAWKYNLSHLERIIGKKLVVELSEGDIMEAREKFRFEKKVPRANATCNKFTTCLRMVLKVARKYGMMNHDPFKDFEKLSEMGARRERYLLDAERESLLRAARQSLNPHLETVINVAIMTGFRLNTIRHLRWTNIDFETSMIRLTRAMVNEEGKRGKPRSPNVPMVPPLRTMLLEQQGKHGNGEFLFPSPEKLNKPIDFRSAWRTAVKRAKLDDFHFHDLRHTTGTYLGRMKTPLHIIQQILGHADPKTTMRYVQSVDETVTSEMSRTFDKLFGSNKG